MNLDLSNNSLYVLAFQKGHRIHRECIQMLCILRVLISTVVFLCLRTFELPPDCIIT